jgi:hypothetical protein
MQQKINNIYRRGQSPSALRQAQDKARSGQAMIMTVLVLSSTVLSLSAIGGYLMLVRLRTSSDVMSTTKAIYAADSGIECEAYNQFQGPQDPAFCISSGRNAFYYNGAVADPTAGYVTTYVPGPPQYTRSTGSFRNSNRAFEMDFN